MKRVVNISILVVLCVVQLGLFTASAEQRSPRFASARAQRMEAREALGRCSNCMHVLESILSGREGPLSSICAELMSLTQSQEESDTCHKVLAALAEKGDAHRWSSAACTMVDADGIKEHIAPCPAHVTCGKIADSNKESFCGMPPGIEYEFSEDA